MSRSTGEKDSLGQSIMQNCLSQIDFSEANWDPNQAIRLFDELVRVNRIRPYYPPTPYNSQLRPTLRPIPVEHVRTGIGHATANSGHIQTPATVRPSNMEKPAVGAWSSQGPAGRPLSQPIKVNLGIIEVKFCGTLLYPAYGFGRHNVDMFIILCEFFNYRPNNRFDPHVSQFTEHINVIIQGELPQHCDLETHILVVNFFAQAQVFICKKEFYSSSKNKIVFEIDLKIVVFIEL